MNKEVENNLTEAAEPGVAEPSPPFTIFPFTGHGKPVFLLCLLGLIFYINTLENEYALDDGLVITQNSYVLQGFEGIPSLLEEDLFHSFYRRMNAGDQLTGGRYRPLPVISFAIEQEILGTYRTGFYDYSADLNNNGRLDNEPVWYTNSKGETELRYEYNTSVDVNNDGVVNEEECVSCWDRNGNFHNDEHEDLNQDGVFNEVDCHVYGAWLRHFINVILYMFCCVAFYFFIARQLLPERPDLAFLASLLFLIHPVHSEVVANVKGREDLLCFLFMILCLHKSIDFARHQRAAALITSVTCGFLALMSKETAVALLVLVPFTLYFLRAPFPRWPHLLVIALIFLICAGSMLVLHLNDDTKHGYGILQYPLMTLGYVGGALLFFKYLKAPSLLLISVFFGVCLLYFALRLNAVNMAPAVPGTEILNDPYLLAKGSEAIATKVYVLLKYLGLLVFPARLISDYSYNAIPYIDFSNALFIASIVGYLLLFAAGIWLSVKRHITGYGIVFYLLFILLVSNLFFDTHIVMLEAYLFHASAGGVIAMAWLILFPFERFDEAARLRARKYIFAALVLVVLVAGIKAWERGADWKNDVTLFLKDVKYQPNSVIILGNAGARWIDLADTKEITGIPFPGQENTPFNDYNGQLRIDDEEWKKAGYANKREAALYRGIGYLKKAVSLHPRYVNGYLNLGLAYYKLRIDDSTMLFWKTAEYYYPSNPYLASYYSVYTKNLTDRANRFFSEQEYTLAEENFKRSLIISPGNGEALMGLAAIKFNGGEIAKAKAYLRMVLNNDPDNEEAKKLMELFSSRFYPENAGK